MKRHQRRAAVLSCGELFIWHRHFRVILQAKVCSGPGENQPKRLKQNHPQRAAIQPIFRSRRPFFRHFPPPAKLSFAVLHEREVVRRASDRDRQRERNIKIVADVENHFVVVNFVVVN